MVDNILKEQLRKPGLFSADLNLPFTCLCHCYKF